MPFWYEDESRRKANRAMVVRWLRRINHRHHRVIMGADQVMEIAYDCSDNSEDALWTLRLFLTNTDRWLRDFPERNIKNADQWLDEKIMWWEGPPAQASCPAAVRT